MTEEQINNTWKKLNTDKRKLLKDINVLRDDFTFDILKTRLASQGIHINEKTF